MYTCPVCFFDQLHEAPTNYNICDCCGTEFGNDDELKTHAELRQDWIARGARWFFGAAPAHWSAWTQLGRGTARSNFVVNIVDSKIQVPYLTFPTTASLTPYRSAHFALSGILQISNQVYPTSPTAFASNVIVSGAAASARIIGQPEAEDQFIGQAA